MPHRAVVARVRASIWEADPDADGFFRRLWVRAGRIGELAFGSVREDQLTLHAAGLTLLSLFTLAPLLAFVFMVFQAIGYGQRALADFRRLILEMPAQVQSFLETILSYVENTSTGVLGATAVLFFLWTVIRVMSSIEGSFNRIWGVTASRPILRKVTDYLSTFVLVPVLVVLAGTVTSLDSAPLWSEHWQFFHWLYRGLLQVAPFLSCCIAFVVLYLFLPNTSVQLKAALVGGVAGALLSTLWQSFYLRFQSMLLQLPDKVFGAFASVPIAMMWLFVTWIIVLFGAEVAFAAQHWRSYPRGRRSEPASAQTRAVLALAILQACTRPMVDDQPIFHAESFRARRGIPHALMQDVLDVLCRARLLGALQDPDGGYVLLKSPELIAAGEILQRLLEDGAPPGRSGLGDVDPGILEAWDQTHDAMRRSLAEFDLRRLAHRDAGPGRAEIPPAPSAPHPTASDA